LILLSKLCIFKAGNPQKEEVSAMRIKKGEVKENLETLKEWEKRCRNKPSVRIKALRLLKEHPQWTLKQVASLLGRSERTLQRWKSYQKEGLSGLLKVRKAGGQRPVKIGPAGLKELHQKLKEDGFCDLKEAQRWLKERFGVSYTLSGVWYLVRVELKAKLKTGRPRSAKQDPQEVEAFKKRGSRRWRIGRSGPKTRPASG
jgi:transposase